MGAYSFVARLSLFTIDHASLSRRSTGGGVGSTRFIHSRSLKTNDPRVEVVVVERGRDGVYMLSRLVGSQ